MQVSITTTAPLVRMGLQNLAKEIPEVGRNQIYLKTRRIRMWLKKPGSPITYPVKWDSEKQRRAYFATDGFGAGIPYRRSGKHAEFKVEKLENGYKVSAPFPECKFIYGDALGKGQSRIHQGRWPIAVDVIEAELSNLPEEVDKALQTEIRKAGF